jgi:adenylosuccinate synthase
LEEIKMVKAVVGACWGDEGKGKITDMLAGDADIVIRFQGGANAGHTIVNEYGKFALHILPSGSFNSNVTNMIGNGVALDIPSLFKELKEIVDRGVPAPKLVISNRAQVLMPYHKLLDTYEEERLSDRQFGSTKSGIAPFFSDKYSKIGFQVWELFGEEELKEKIKNVVEVKNLILEHVYHKPLLDAEELYKTCKEYAEIVRPYVIDTVPFMHEAIKSGKNILLEGQLGSLKDPDFGIYPFTTSSSPLAGYGAIGACIPPYEIKEIITVVKAYSSAVGAGAFVSEIFGEEADELRRRGGDGGEYGATTGRPRRMGWFDCVASRYGCRVQGTTGVAFTVLDVLGYLDEIPVCVGYEINGEVTRDFPTTDLLNIAKPVLKVFPGWKCDIRGIKKYEDLPQECRDYIEFIEKELEVPITIVSNGPAREDIIMR